MENENNNNNTRIQRIEQFMLDPEATIFESMEELGSSIQTLQDMLDGVDLSKLEMIEGKTPERGVDYMTDEDLVAIEEYIDERLPIPGVDYPTETQVNSYIDEKTSVISSLIDSAVAKIPRIRGDRGEKGDRGDNGSPDTGEDIIKKIRGLGKNQKLKISDIRGLDNELTSVRQYVDDEISTLRKYIDGINITIPASTGNGGGIDNITGLISEGTNIVITGSGTSGDPYVINATGDISPVSFGTTTQIPYMNSSGDDFLYSSSFTFNGSTLSLGSSSITMTGALGTTGARISKGWFTDLEVTNTIVGNITGSATTLTTTRTIWGQNFNGSANVTGEFISTIPNSGNVDVMTLTQSDTTNNKDGLVITGATTGRMIKLVPTGNTPVNAVSGGAFLLDNTLNSGIGMHIYSNQSSAAGLGVLLRIHADNNSFAQPALHIVQDGTSGSACNIRLDGFAPQIEFVELDQVGTDGSGKFEIGVNGDIFYISGRLADNSGFTDTIKIDRQANGGGIRFYGSTSGYTKIKSEAVAGTTTWTLPAVTDTFVGITASQTLTNKRITKRVTSETSSATPTINTDNCDIHRITALATNITSFTTNLSGTPTHGQSLIIEITGTATRTISWGSSFESSTVSLPTATDGTNMLMVGFTWNSATSKWRCVAVA